MRTRERQELVDYLSAIGIEKGDRLFVHSSFNALGFKNLTPVDIVDGLKEIVGESGTIGMPAFTYSTNPDKPFSFSKSPSIVGAITEAFRTSPGVVRSLNPTHSCSFWGMDADYCASSKMVQRPYHMGGPFGKMYELGFKILMLGCGTGSNSTLHAVEDWADLPYVKNGVTTCFREYGDPKGEEQTHMPIGHRDFYSGENSKYHKLLKKHNLISMGVVGQGKTHLIPVRDMIDVCMEELDENPDLFLCDDPNCLSCKLNHYGMDVWKKNGGTSWNQIWLGSSKTDITQGVGALTNQGWGSGAPCEGVRSNLHARVLVLKKRHEYYAIVSLEVIRNNRAKQLRRAIFEKSKIPPENILVSCTHTHTGPAMGRDTFGKGNASIDEAYLGFLHAKVAGAVYEAKRDLKPAFISHKSIQVDIDNINRNVRLDDGTFKYFDQTPDCPLPNGPVAKDFSIFVLKDRNGIVIAGLGHYACHPIFGPPDAREICGDYPGYFSEICERELGDKTVVCFLQGALGNQMPLHYGSSFENAEKAGKKLAHEFLRHCDEEGMEPLTTIKIRKRDYTAKKMKPTKTFELAALFLNQYKFGYGGGELFYQLAKRFAEKVDDPDAVWVGLTDDRMYLPDEKTFPSETYEIRMAKEVMGCEPGIGEEIVDACAELF